MSNEECRCPCHTNPDIRHIVACCMTCEHCGKRIRLVSYGKHVEECSSHVVTTNNNDGDLENTLVKALAFYAEPNNWDDGDFARKVLSHLNIESA